MSNGAVERALRRIDAAVERRAERADVDAVLERARTQVEALAQSAAELESTLPSAVGEAVREGVRAEALPVARQLAEVRGLLNLLIRRLERVEGDLAADRHSRVDDLGLLVDLVTSGWKSVDDRLARLDARLANGDLKSVDERLARLEQSFSNGNGAIVYRIEELRPPAAADQARLET